MTSRDGPGDERLHAGHDPTRSPDPGDEGDGVRNPPPGSKDPRVTRLPPDGKPTRQLRRVGVKIGRRVLPYERTLVQLGPLRLVRTAQGRLAVRWIRRRKG